MKRKNLRITLLIIIAVLILSVATSCTLFKKQLESEFNIQYDMQNDKLTWSLPTNGDANIEWDIIIRSNDTKVIKYNNNSYQETQFDLKKIEDLKPGNNYLVELFAKHKNGRMKNSKTAKFLFYYADDLNEKVRLVYLIKDETYGLLQDNPDIFDEVTLDIVNKDKEIKFQGKMPDFKEQSKDILSKDGEYKFNFYFKNSKGKYKPFTLTEIIKISKDEIDKAKSIQIEGSDNDLKDGISITAKNFKSSYIVALRVILNDGQIKEIPNEHLHIFDGKIDIDSAYFDKVLAQGVRYESKKMDFNIQISIDSKINYSYPNIEYENFIDSRNPEKYSDEILKVALIQDKINPLIKYDKKFFNIEKVELQGTLLDSDDYQEEILGGNLTLLTFKKQISEILGIPYKDNQEFKIRITFKKDTLNHTLEYTVRVSKQGLVPTGLYNITQYSDISAEYGVGDLSIIINSEMHLDSSTPIKIQKDIIVPTDEYSINKKSAEDYEYELVFKNKFLKRFNIGEILDVHIQSDLINSTDFKLHFIDKKFKVNSPEKVYISDGNKFIEVKINNLKQAEITDVTIDSNEISSYTFASNTLTLQEGALKNLSNGHHRVGVIYKKDEEKYAYYFSIYIDNNKIEVKRFDPISSNEYRFYLDFPYNLDIKNAKVKVDSNNNAFEMDGNILKISNADKLSTGKHKLSIEANREDGTKLELLNYEFSKLDSKYDEYLDQKFYVNGEDYNLYIETEEEFYKLLTYLIRDSANYDNKGKHGVFNVTKKTGDRESWNLQTTSTVKFMYYKPGQLDLNHINKFYPQGYRCNFQQKYYLTDNEKELTITNFSTTNPSQKQPDYTLYNYERIEAEENYYAGKYGYKKRDNSFDDFPGIKKLKKTNQTVEFTDDLYATLENGYYPKLKSGSVAEKAIKEAKNVLREIISDEMSDYEKVVAIYKWTYENVSYDYATVDHLKLNKLHGYYMPAFFIEGILLRPDKMAVCDGIAKSFVLFTTLEGLNSHHLSGMTYNGSAYDAPHAWNKVQIGDYWYFMDVTWGYGKVIGKDQALYSDKYLLGTSKAFESADVAIKKDRHIQKDLYKKYECVDSQFKLYTNVRIKYDKNNDTKISIDEITNRYFDIALANNLRKKDLFKAYYKKNGVEENRGIIYYSDGKRKKADLTYITNLMF